MSARPLVFSWFLPTGGDGRIPGGATVVEGRSAGSGRRVADVRYLAQVAQAAELAGFDGVLTPVGLGCPDPWVVCSAVAQHTDRLRFIVAARIGLTSATLLAQQADTFARLTGGRLTVNAVTGGDPHEQRQYGDHLAHDDRYARTAEVLDAVRRLLAGETVTTEGPHVQVQDARLPEATPYAVPLYFGGASPAAEDVAVAHADVALMWGEPREAVAARVARLTGRAQAGGRSLGTGLRLHVIARESSAAAWTAAEEIQERFDPAAVRATQERFARMDSVGQARMAALHAFGTARSLEVGPNLWAGIGLVREGAGTALVGSYDEVADRLAEYAAAGIGEFILSGYPHLEEALRVGDEVLPRVRARVAPVREAV
jgi:alkanesulfonate monooxygenase